jgi:hypothetical protein
MNGEELPSWVQIGSPMVRIAKITRFLAERNERLLNVTVPPFIWDMISDEARPQSNFAQFEYTLDAKALIRLGLHGRVVRIVAGDTEELRRTEGSHEWFVARLETALGATYTMPIGRR